MLRLYVDCRHPQWQYPCVEHPFFPNPPHLQRASCCLSDSPIGIASVGFAALRAHRLRSPVSRPDKCIFQTNRLASRQCSLSSHTTPSPGAVDALDAAGIDAPQDVYWGEETADEMCMAMVGLVLPPADWLSLLSDLF